MGESTATMLQNLAQILHFLGKYKESNELIAISVIMMDNGVLDADELRTLIEQLKKGLTP